MCNLCCGRMIDMLALYIILALIIHFIVLVLIDKQMRRLRIPRRLQILLSFVLLGTVVGAIAMAINDSFICRSINPLGSVLAEAIHDNWWNAEYRPSDWENMLPWIIRYPQVYLFTTMLLYAIISLFFMIRLWRDKFSVQDFMGPRNPG